MPEVLVALGTNVGDRVEKLCRAHRLLERAYGDVLMSSLYETAPMYVVDQPKFLNACARFRTSAGPLSILRTLKGIESEMGRMERDRYGPREIDLDLVAYGCLRYRFHDGRRTVLNVPHPRTGERRFVLAPLAEIAADLYLPTIGNVPELLAQTNDQASGVLKLEDAQLSL